MRKRLQLALMLTRTTAIATSLAFFPLTSSAWAEGGDNSTHGITATQDHGRMIYVNEDGPARERATPAPAPEPKRSGLVYWSSKENRWKPVPSANTRLMQLMPQTARQLRVKNPFHAEQNVDAGVRHLKSLLQSYNGDVNLTLAAYN